MSDEESSDNSFEKLKADRIKLREEYLRLLEKKKSKKSEKKSKDSDRDESKSKKKHKKKHDSPGPSTSDKRRKSPKRARSSRSSSSPVSPDRKRLRRSPPPVEHRSRFHSHSRSYQSPSRRRSPGRRSSDSYRQHTSMSSPHSSHSPYAHSSRYESSSSRYISSGGAVLVRRGPRDRSRSRATVTEPDDQERMDEEEDDYDMPTNGRSGGEDQEYEEEYNRLLKKELTAEDIRLLMPLPIFVKVEPISEAPAPPKIVRKISPNPKFVLTIDRILKRMKKYTQDIDENVKPKFIKIMEKVLRFKVKEMLKEQKISSYMTYRSIMELYMQHFNEDVDKQLIQDVLTGTQKGLFDEYVPSDDEDEAIKKDSDQIFLTFIAEQKKNAPTTAVEEVMETEVENVPVKVEPASPKQSTEANDEIIDLMHDDAENEIRVKKESDSESMNSANTLDLNVGCKEEIIDEEYETAEKGYRPETVSQNVATINIKTENNAGVSENNRTFDKDGSVADSWQIGDIHSLVKQEPVDQDLEKNQTDDKDCAAPSNSKQVSGEALVKLEPSKLDPENNQSVHKDGSANESKPTGDMQNPVKREPSEDHGRSLKDTETTRSVKEKTTDIKKEPVLETIKVKEHKTSTTKPKVGTTEKTKGKESETVVQHKEVTKEVKESTSTVKTQAKHKESTSTDKTQVKHKESTLTDKTHAKHKESTSTDKTQAKHKESTPADKTQAKDKESTSTDKTQAKDKESTPADKTQAKHKEFTSTDKTQAKDKESTPADKTQAKDKESTPADKTQTKDKESTSTDKTQAKDKDSKKHKKSKKKSSDTKEDKEKKKKKKSKDEIGKSKDTEEKNDVKTEPKEENLEMIEDFVATAKVVKDIINID